MLAAAVAGHRRSGNDAYRLESVEQHGDRVIVAFSWSDKHCERHEWAQALQIRDGRIVDMQDYRSRTHARLRVAFG